MTMMAPAAVSVSRGLSRGQRWAWPRGRHAPSAPGGRRELSKTAAGRASGGGGETGEKTGPRASRRGGGAEQQRPLRHLWGCGLNHGQRGKRRREWEDSRDMRRRACGERWRRGRFGDVAQCGRGNCSSWSLRAAARREAPPFDPEIGKGRQNGYCTAICQRYSSRSSIYSMVWKQGGGRRHARSVIDKGKTHEDGEGEGGRGGKKSISIPFHSQLIGFRLPFPRSRFPLLFYGCLTDLPACSLRIYFADKK